MSLSLPHRFIATTLRDMAEQKTKKVAWDGEFYTEHAFCRVYGSAGKKFWRDAVHHPSLADFVVRWGVTAMRWGENNGVELAESAARNEIGIVFPAMLLLFDVQHLKGKLKRWQLGARSAEDEVPWNASILIGIRNERGEQIDCVHAADMRKAVYERAELHDMGQRVLIRAGRYFLAYLEEPESSEERVVANPLLRFMCGSTEQQSGGLAE